MHLNGIYDAAKRYASAGVRLGHTSYPKVYQSAGRTSAWTRIISSKSLV
jgi:hypothetical protein